MRMSLRLTAISVYLSALRIGAVSLLRGNLIDGLKQLIAPVGYWRLLPNAVVLAEAKKLVPNAKVLDVSSPKLPSLILGSRAEIWATDLDDPQLIGRWQRTAKAIGLQRYHVQYENACRLSFPDNTFDMVYSISVVEHIPDNGDSLALSEFQRVLKPGGIAIVEVPFRRKHQDIMQNYDSKGFPLSAPRFYERYYDSESVDQRLQADNLILAERWILGEWFSVDKWIATARLPRVLRLAILPVEPWIALVNYWIGKTDTSGNPLGALLVFRKSIS
jgi:SAM-dependent methyltransferase